MTQRHKESSQILSKLKETSVGPTQIKSTLLYPRAAYNCKIDLLDYFHLQKKRLSIANSLSDGDSNDGRETSLTTPPSSQCGDSLERQKRKERIIIVKKMEPTPTANLNRSNDRVYECTTCVVKSVMALSQGN